VTGPPQNIPQGWFARGSPGGSAATRGQRAATRSCKILSPPTNRPDLPSEVWPVGCGGGGACPTRGCGSAPTVDNFAETQSRISRPNASGAATVRIGSRCSANSCLTRSGQPDKVRLIRNCTPNGGVSLCHGSCW
jgi:hypothetical protein